MNMVIYILLAVICTLVILFWKKLHLGDEIRLYFVLGAAIGVLGLASVLSGNDGRLKLDEDGRAVLERREPGKGSYTEKLVLELEGVQRDYSVRIDDEHLSETEVNEAFVSAVETIDRSFFGENMYQDEVRGHVNPLKLIEVAVAGDRS